MKHKLYFLSKLEWCKGIVATALTLIISWPFASKKPDFIVIWGGQVAVFLLGTYLVTSYFAYRNEKENISRAIADKVCSLVFSSCLKPLPIAHGKLRVSLFKAHSGRNPEKVTLKCVGRHEVRQPLKRCKIPFDSGQGCVGIAYAEGLGFYRKGIQKFDDKNPERYYKESLKEFHLPLNKTRALNIKACDFVCLPVKYLDSDRVWGVLCLDSEIMDTFGNAATILPMRKQIQDILLGFSIVV